MAFPGGSYYPFQLRAIKAEVLHRIGRWNELIPLLRRDLARAQELEVVLHQGRCLLKLGTIDAQRGNFAQAEKNVAQALEKYERAGDRAGIFRSRATLFMITLNLKDYQRAEKITTGLLAEARKNQDLPGESEMLNNMGLLCIEAGKNQQALEYFNLKLELSRRIGDGSESAHAVGNIGRVHLINKNWPEAMACCREAIKLSRRTGDIFAEYYALYNLAQACQEQGLTDEARTHYRRDLEMARQLGDGPGAAVILRDMENLNRSEKNNAGGQP